MRFRELLRRPVGILEPTETQGEIVVNLWECRIQVDAFTKTGRRRRIFPLGVKDVPEVVLGAPIVRPRRDQSRKCILGAVQIGQCS
jgi:hypothetical protein